MSGLHWGKLAAPVSPVESEVLSVICRLEFYGIPETQWAHTGPHLSTTALCPITKHCQLEGIVFFKPVQQGLRSGVVNSNDLMCANGLNYVRALT